MDVATDQVIDAAAAQSLSADVRRDHVVAAWIIVCDQPMPGTFTARLVTGMPTPRDNRPADVLREPSL